MADSLHILLLEDSPTDAELIERFLRKSGLVFDSWRVEREETFLDALATFRPDVILADYSLPRFDGLQALSLVRERDPDLPFIFVTGALGEEGAVELLCNGANDYVLKDLLTRLPMALERALDTARQRKALRQAEQSLKESEERFRAIVETTLDCIWEVDAEGRYTYVSPASISLLGYAPEEMLGRRPIDFMPPSEATRVDASLAEIFATQCPFSLLENTCLRKDGMPVHMETSGIPIVGPDGRLLGYRGIDRDITQRKRHVATLMLQAKRATALLELPRAAERLEEKEFMRFGQELAEELTDSRIAFIHFVNEDQETIELVTWSRRTLRDYCRAVYDKHYPISQAGIWADALRRRAPVVFNDYPMTPHKYGLPEGHAELIRLISVPVMEGNLVRMMAGVGNKDTLYNELDVETVQLIANEIWRIVRQRRAEQELRKLSLAVEQSPASIVITDLDARIEYANPAFTRISGYSLDEAMAQNPRILQSGRTPPEVFEDLWTTLAQEMSGAASSTAVRTAANISSWPLSRRCASSMEVSLTISRSRRTLPNANASKKSSSTTVCIWRSWWKPAPASSGRWRNAADSSWNRVPMDSMARISGTRDLHQSGRLRHAGISTRVLGHCTHDLIHHSYPDGMPYPKEDCPIHGPRPVVECYGKTRMCSGEPTVAPSGVLLIPSHVPG